MIRCDIGGGGGAQMLGGMATQNTDCCGMVGFLLLGLSSIFLLGSVPVSALLPTTMCDEATAVGGRDRKSTTLSLDQHCCTRNTRPR